MTALFGGWLQQRCDLSPPLLWPFVNAASAAVVGRQRSVGAGLAASARRSPQLGGDLPCQSGRQRRRLSARGARPVVMEMDDAAVSAARRIRRPGRRRHHSKCTAAGAAAGPGLLRWVMWVIGHVVKGHESWVTWVVGQMGHRILLVLAFSVERMICRLGHVGRGSCGSWFIGHVGHMGHRSCGSWVRRVTKCCWFWPSPSNE